jgi:hypothetical protein
MPLWLDNRFETLDVCRRSFGQERLLVFGDFGESSSKARG